MLYVFDVMKCDILQFQIEKETTKARRMVARVRKEVEIHSRLKHPSILEVKEIKGIKGHT